MKADVKGTDRQLDRSELREKYNIPSKGKTLSGHFRPEAALDVIETAVTRSRSVSEIVTAAVEAGLPIVKKRMPPIRIIS